MNVRPIPNGVLVLDGVRCVAGIGHHWYRPWLYPLFTPAGRQVLREFPFDHPFHNGCFVAQHPVRFAGGEANFWAVPPQRAPQDDLFADVGRVEVASLAFPVLRCIWRAPDGRPVLEEERRFEIEVRGDATVCAVTSSKTASFGDLEFPATKFGGIAVRVDPQLLPAAGARMVGEHDAAAPFVAYENGRFGLALTAEDRGPWFLRDYGLAAWNPTWKSALSLPRGETWTLRLTLVAYDGALPSWIASSR